MSLTGEQECCKQKGYPVRRQVLLIQWLPGLSNGLYFITFRPKLTFFMPVDLERLDRLCKGNSEKKKRYLRQFLEMIPPAIGEIGAALAANDSQTVRQRTHFLAPQLAFFGINDFILIQKQFGAQPPTAILNDLRKAIEQAVDKTNQATTEVQKLLNDQNRL